MLAGGLLLDGVAAEVLCRRGFGAYIGVDVLEIVAREERSRPGPYAGERTADTELQNELGLEHTILSVNVQPALARLEPLPGACLWTEVLTTDGTRWGAGRTVFENDLGGRAAVLAATAPAELPGSDQARALLHHTIRYLEADSPAVPLVTGGPNLIPRLTRADGLDRLAIANASADPARPVVAFPTPVRPRTTKLEPLAAPEPASAVSDGSRLRAESALGHRGWLILEWKPSQAANPTPTDRTRTGWPPSQA